MVVRGGGVVYTLDEPLPHKPPLEGFLSAVSLKGLAGVLLELWQRWLPRLDTLSLVFIST